MHVSERWEWKPFKSSMATAQPSVCVVGVMLGFGENSRNKILMRWFIAETGLDPRSSVDLQLFMKLEKAKTQ